MRALGWEDDHLVVAEGVAQRLRGMIAHEAPGGCGAGVVMGFPRCRSVHTWFMRRRIDIAFLDARGAVIETHRGVEPWRVRSCLRAASTLERVTPAPPRENC